MLTLHCIVYSLHIVQWVHFTLYSVFTILCTNVHIHLDNIYPSKIPRRITTISILSAIIVYTNANSTYCTVYTIHCTVYNIQCAVYNVYHTEYNAHCKLYTVQCTYILYTICKIHCCTLYSELYLKCYTLHCTRHSVLGVQGKLSRIQCTLYTVQCIIYTVHGIYNAQYTVYNVHCTVYSVHCTMYSVHCTTFCVRFIVYDYIYATWCISINIYPLL